MCAFEIPHVRMFRLQPIVEREIHTLPSPVSSNPVANSDYFRLLGKQRSYLAGSSKFVEGSFHLYARFCACLLTWRLRLATKAQKTCEDALSEKGAFAPKKD